MDPDDEEHLSESRQRFLIVRDGLVQPLQHGAPENWLMFGSVARRLDVGMNRGLNAVAARARATATFHGCMQR